MLARVPEDHPDRSLHESLLEWAEASLVEPRPWETATAESD